MTATTRTDRKRPRWLSVAKWIGLYLLAQIIGGFTVGFFFGGGTGRDALFSAAIFIAMIVYAVVVNRRRQRGAASETVNSAAVSRG